MQEDTAFGRCVDVGNKGPKFSYENTMEDIFVTLYANHKYPLMSVVKKRGVANLYVRNSHNHRVWGKRRWEN